MKYTFSTFTRTHETDCRPFLKNFELVLKCYFDRYAQVFLCVRACTAKRAYYNGAMSTKAIVIGVVVLIIIAIGAYFLMKGSAPAQAPATDAQSQTSATAATTAATSSTQVQAQEVTVGKGNAATPGSSVSVLYVGKLQDGTVFDSSAAHGNQPLTFTLGAQGLIAGFQIGVNGMKEGGERLIAVPPTLGYGAQDVKDPSGKVIIPANSTLVFDIKLVKVAAATAPAATGGTKTQ
jgi:hypothetical protein